MGGDIVQSTIKECNYVTVYNDFLSGTMENVKGTNSDSRVIFDSPCTTHTKRICIGRNNNDDVVYWNPADATSAQNVPAHNV